jgi:hypothetical protein
VSRETALLGPRVKVNVGISLRARRVYAAVIGKEVDNYLQPAQRSAQSSWTSCTILLLHSQFTVRSVFTIGRFDRPRSIGELIHRCEHNRATR